MPKAKKYRYKLWLEVERVEIDHDNIEIGDHEPGPKFGFVPEKLGQYDNISEAKLADIVEQMKDTR